MINNTNTILTEVRDSNVAQEALKTATNNLLEDIRVDLTSLEVEQAITSQQLADANVWLETNTLAVQEIKTQDETFYLDLLAVQNDIKSRLDNTLVNILNSIGSNGSATRDKIDILIDQTDQIEVLLTSINTNLVANRTANSNELEQLRLLLVAVDANTDEVEGQLTTILGEVDEVEEKLDEVISALTPVDETQVITTGTNISIPAGFKTVLINSLGGNNTLDFGGGNTFQLGGGRRADGITLEGSNLNTKNGLLPAITISGGTWQWIVLSTLTP